MSVNVGNRKQSRIEVLNTALKLNDAISQLSLRSFGIRSRNSPLRRKYQNLVKSDDSEILDNFIMSKRLDIEDLGDKIVHYVNAAQAIYPRFESEFNTRLEYQNKALATCEMVDKTLNKVASTFDVDIMYFKEVVSLLNNEKHLIIEWRKSDRYKFKGHLLH